MPNLFDTLIINKLELRNRFLRSATMETLGDQGMVTDDLLAFYRELASGEIGLIVTGGVYAKKDGQTAPGQLAADTDKVIPGLKRLATVVHENGGKIAAQLLHTGWNARPEVTGFQPAGPSATVHPRTGLQVRELSGDEVYELVEIFAPG